MGEFVGLPWSLSVQIFRYHIHVGQNVMVGADCCYVLSHGFLPVGGA